MAKTEIQKVETPQAPIVAAAEFLKQESGIDVDKLAKLFEIQEKWDAEQARKAYHVAMADFKANPPEILKDRHVKFTTSKGTTEYDHATLWNITKTINESLSKYGFSATWETGQDNGAVKVTCKLTHVLGHCEQTTLSAPPDKSGGKNDIQAVGSAVSYLQRYTLLAATGLTTQDMDDDGKGADKGPQIPEPTKKEMELTDKIRKALFDTAAEKGLTLKPVEEIAKLIFAFYGKYPTAKVAATTAAAAIIGANRLNSFCNAKEDAA